MQELGVWVTNEGTKPASLQFESDGWDANAEELPSWLTGAAKGAVAGAATGAAAGPWGALIGAAAGGALGAATSATGPATAPTPSPAGGATGAAATATAAAPATRPATASGDAATRAKVAQALQQFALMVPTLVQLLATSSGGAKELAVSDNGAESTADAWGPETFQGTWSVP